MRDALDLLCEAEVRHREERRIRMGLGIAKFPFVRTLDGFDLEAQPSSARRRTIRGPKDRPAAAGRRARPEAGPRARRPPRSADRGPFGDGAGACRAGSVANGDALLLLGPPGVGKTHLAVALGREAVRLGYTVLFVPATALLAALARAHAGGRLDERLAFYAKPRLPIAARPRAGLLAGPGGRARLPAVRGQRRASVLPAGLAPRSPPSGGHSADRGERGSLLVTSNRPVGASAAAGAAAIPAGADRSRCDRWGTVFGDPVVATAILDRLLHHSHVLTIRGDRSIARRSMPAREAPLGPDQGRLARAGAGEGAMTSPACRLGRPRAAAASLPEPAPAPAGPTGPTRAVRSPACWGRARSRRGSLPWATWTSLPASLGVQLLVSPGAQFLMSFDSVGRTLVPDDDTPEGRTVRPWKRA